MNAMTMDGIGQTPMRRYLALSFPFLPIDRLRHMNPLAIELYRRYKVDIAAELDLLPAFQHHFGRGIRPDAERDERLQIGRHLVERGNRHGIDRRRIRDFHAIGLRGRIMGRDGGRGAGTCKHGGYHAPREASRFRFFRH